MSSKRIAVAAAVLLAGTALVASAVGATAAAPAPQVLLLKDALVPGTATDGSALSLAEQQATLAGFTPVVKTGAEWKAMTASDFAAYRALVIPDAQCAGLDTIQAAIDSIGVWGPVVTGTNGNRVLVGTDEVFHDTGPSGPHRGDLLERNGIGFAGAVPGATGVYFSLGCTYEDSTPKTPLPFLDKLTSKGPGAFTATGVPCDGGISIVASSGPTSGLHDADLSDWSCSVHEAFDTFPSDFTPLALATDPAVPQIYSASDVETGMKVTGSPYILVAGTGFAVKSDVALTPPTATSAVGSAGSVTATVTTSGTPVVGAKVEFSVDSGPDTGKTFSGTTGSSGTTTFSFVNNGSPGADSISATYVDALGITQKGLASHTFTTASASSSPIDSSTPPPPTTTAPPALTITHLDVLPTTFHNGTKGTVTVKATLTVAPKDTKGVGRERLVFGTAGKTIGSALTSYGSGQAQLTVPATKWYALVRAHGVTVTFAGDSTYAPAAVTSPYGGGPA